MRQWMLMLLMMVPVLVLADPGSMSFSPPATDYSVIFLTNIFGTVDGILQGNGNQIMGTMFMIFNSAVLALGGIIIMYTLMVSTMNTAHEGQMLGQKWSSIWIPVRSTVGLALLIPKASGYCLMQIFIMWVVVQGVGAADKVWDAALQYLSKGGVIVRVQPSPTDALIGSLSADVPQAAQVILVGQVCMLGLQRQLEKQLQGYLLEKASKTGPCYYFPPAPLGDYWRGICNSGQVPDFLSTLNVAAYQQSHQPSFVPCNPRYPQSCQSGPGDDLYRLKMPDFESGLYSSMSGVCGTLTWKAIDSTVIDQIKRYIPGLTPDDLQTLMMSRTIALQQLVSSLQSIAQVIVNNDPVLTNNPMPGASPAVPWAIEAFGVPRDLSGNPCGDTSNTACFTWGSDGGSAALFNGPEFLTALDGYNEIMQTTLNLINQSRSLDPAKHYEFINESMARGWITAGSYYFDLIMLNGNAAEASSLQDADTGMDKSTFDIAWLLNYFNTDHCWNYPVCFLLGKDQKESMSRIQPVVDLITGDGVAPTKFVQMIRYATTGNNASTVYGYINNATIFRLPGQPGMTPITFIPLIKVENTPMTYTGQPKVFPCGAWDWGILGCWCVGRGLGDIFYNKLLLVVFNDMLEAFAEACNFLIEVLVMYPMAGIASIFQTGIALINTPGTNPIVALAQMGTYYINFAGELWIQMMTLTALAAAIPIVGVGVLALLGIVMPIVMTWLGAMVGVGFLAAYYIPLLPYMIFTFGAIAWLMAVVEAIVAGPLIALGVTHPEGHDAFGKAENAIMILMNVFLRPAMMIIGYVSGIILSYVGIWVMNAGFQRAISFSQNGELFPTTATPVVIGDPTSGLSIAVGGGYSNWAGFFAFFFAMLIYMMMYLTIVEKAFTLIAVLPDKVLRWIGGQPEQAGAEAAQWGDQAKQKITESGKETSGGQAQSEKQATAAMGKAGNKIKEKYGAMKGLRGGEIEGEGTKPKPEGDG